MDAPEDRDAKLHRASSELIADFGERLPKLLWRVSRTRDSEESARIPRKWVRASDTFKLIDLLQRFQEWPQLLDPHLKRFLPPIIDAFLNYLRLSAQNYKQDAQNRGGLRMPLPRALCQLLYVFSKVRGVKVVSRFFSNEAKYLEPVLKAFIDWDTPYASSEGSPGQCLIWEERYIMLMWLSHLLLAPFDLKNISSGSMPIFYSDEAPQLATDIPSIAKTILGVSIKYLVVPGKEREAASTLLVRLTMRQDLQCFDILQDMISWSLAKFQGKGEANAPPVYTCIGVFSFIAGITASGQAQELAKFVPNIFRTNLSVVQKDDPFSQGVRSSALARKLIIKVLRTTIVLALSLEEKSLISSDDVATMLEDAIEYLLNALADKDTPVRLAASKALSVITLRLDSSMATEVVEAVIGSLDENVLWENPSTGLLMPSSAITESQIRGMKPNLSSVNPLRWQGLMLTLGHLLFRRSPPVFHLPSILKCLILGLEFEQRSSTGSSVGVSVRDAANFGIWSVSRKYSTRELLELGSSPVLGSSDEDSSNYQQLLAAKLVAAACLDPSGNVRRGSSAALQELIGRHPDMIIEGISVVQTVDYHGVARRSKALLEVAESAAKLGDVYWKSLLDAIVEWRGLDSPDAESRRSAAIAVGKISLLHSYTGLERSMNTILDLVSRLQPNAVELRHGCILALAAIVDSYINLCQTDTHNSGASVRPSEGMRNGIPRLWDLLGPFQGEYQQYLTSPALRPDLTAEACCKLASSLAQAHVCDLGKSLDITQPDDQSFQNGLKVLSICLSRTEDNAVQASSRAAADIFAMLDDTTRAQMVRTWTQDLMAEESSGGRKGFGHVAALGAIYGPLMQRDDFLTGSKVRKREEDDSRAGLQEEVAKELISCTETSKRLELRVAALRSLYSGVLDYRVLDEDIIQVLERSLNDYTTDQRGDVGSLLRLEAIEAVKVLSKKIVKDPRTAQFLVRPITRLATEKLDKVRYHAWLCFQTLWDAIEQFPPRTNSFDHLGEVSLSPYFGQLLRLTISVPWLRSPILRGYVTCAGGGAEATLRASRDALVELLVEKEGSETPIFILEGILNVLEEQMTEDRYAIPSLEVLSFLLSSGLVTSIDSAERQFRRCFVLTQKAHFRSSNIPRLEAAVKVYAALLDLRLVRQDVASKLVNLMLHPYPKVRTAAAECLLVHFDSDIAAGEDWSKSPKELKIKAQAFKKSIGV